MDLSGQSITSKIDGYDLEVVFPEAPPDGSGRYDPESDARDPEGRIAYFIQHVDVYTHADFAFCEIMESAFKDAFNACAKAATLIVDTCRIFQPTTGLAGLLPPLQAVRAFIGDEWSHPIHFWHYRPKSMVVGWPSPALSNIQAVLAGQELDIPAVLFAQATNLAMSNPNSTNGPAVTLAAIACEVKIKQKLVDSASIEQRELLALLVPQGKRSLFAVADLINHVARAVLNRSLAAEDPGLYRRYNALITARNTFAHRGVELAEKEAWAHVVTARDVLAWIDSLP